MVHGIIYAIIDDGYFYIGSTKQTLELRIYQHIMDSKTDSHKNSKIYKYINEIRGGWNDIIYITLEEVECNNINELKKIEYQYIEKCINDNKCLNTVKNIKHEYVIRNIKNKKYYK